MTLRTTDNTTAATTGMISINQVADLIAPAVITDSGNAWSFRPVNGLNLPGLVEGSTFTSRDAARSQLVNLIANHFGVGLSKSSAA